jgi:hypothetical protein
MLFLKYNKVYWWMWPREHIYISQCHHNLNTCLKNPRWRLLRCCMYSYVHTRTYTCITKHWIFLGFLRLIEFDIPEILQCFTRTFWSEEHSRDDLRWVCTGEMMTRFTTSLSMTLIFKVFPIFDIKHHLPVLFKHFNFLF